MNKPAPAAPPSAKRAYRRRMAEARTPPAPSLKAPAPKLSVPASPKPPLAEELAMSKAETAVARLRVDELEKRIAYLEVALEDEIAKQSPKRQVIAGIIIPPRGAYGLGDFLPQMARRLIPGDLLLVEHQGDSLEIRHERAGPEEAEEPAGES